MGLKAFYEKIKTLELEINPEKITYSGFNAWPYFRLKIWHKFVSKVEVHKKAGFTFKNIVSVVKSVWLYYKNPVRRESSDILYFTRSSECQDVVEGKLFNRYSDSFREFYGDKYKIKVFETTDKVIRSSLVRYNVNVTFLDFLIFLTRVKFKLKTLLRRKCKTFSFFDLSVRRIFGFDLVVGEELEWISMLSSLFEAVLRKYNPQLVFFVCYYRSEAMALSLACRRLNIKAVEVQHGAQNDLHGMYTNWNDLPEGGYDLMPDVFWMWGSIPGGRVLEWAQKTERHKVFVGGNLWLAYMKGKLATGLNFRGGESSTSKTNKAKILVSLQGDDLIPDFFLGWLEKHASSYSWYFRDHPRLPLSTKMKSKLSSYAEKDITEVSVSCLYSMLVDMDLHMTGFSTVAFEALAFNVSTVFFHHNAKLGFNNQLGKGLYYADSIKCLTLKVEEALVRQEVCSDYIKECISGEEISSLLSM